MTLGLSGWFNLAHGNVEFQLLSPNTGNDTYNNTTIHEKIISIFFNDPLSFGTLKLTKDTVESKLNKLGFDPLKCSNDNNEDKKQWLKLLRKHNKRNLAWLLLKQNHIAGIGNYLRSEILYLAKLNPLTLIQERSDQDLLNLLKISRERMEFKRSSYSINNIPLEESSKGKLLIYKNEKTDQGHPVKVEKCPHKRKIYWDPLVQTF